MVAKARESFGDRPVPVVSLEDHRDATHDDAHNELHDAIDQYPLKIRICAGNGMQKRDQNFEEQEKNQAGAWSGSLAVPANRVSLQRCLCLCRLGAYVVRQEQI